MGILFILLTFDGHRAIFVNCIHSSDGVMNYICNLSDIADMYYVKVVNKLPLCLILEVEFSIKLTM